MHRLSCPAEGAVHEGSGQCSGAKAVFNRHQLTIINAFSAALCRCIVYLLVRQLTGRRSIAWAAAAFHLSGAFFLNLAIINEDIMPS
ncbi:MAG: hypothetical protein ACT4O6_26835, partial [Reyranella sp.]